MFQHILDEIWIRNDNVHNSFENHVCIYENDGPLIQFFSKVIATV